jgi:hypothetical protein
VDGEWLVTQESFLSDFDTSLDASGKQTRSLKVRKTARIKVSLISANVLIHWFWRNEIYYANALYCY